MYHVHVQNVIDVQSTLGCIDDLPTHDEEQMNGLDLCVSCAFE